MRSINRTTSKAQELEVDADGNLYVTVDTAAQDTANGVYAVAEKGVVGATYSRARLGEAFASNAATFKASAGQAAALQLVNRNSAARYFGLVNKATAPENGDAMALTIYVPPTSMFVLGDDFFGRNGFYLSAGVSGAWSTTPSTVTLATAGEHDAVVMGY